MSTLVIEHRLNLTAVYIFTFKQARAAYVKGHDDSDLPARACLRSVWSIIS